MAKIKFEIIYTVLKTEISEGVYNATMLLPTELELAQRFTASRNTVRRAIQQLNEEGLVYSVKGRGVVILEKSKANATFFKMGNFQGLGALSSDKTIQAKTIVNAFEEMTVNEKLAEEISFPPDERVYYIERIRLINGVAVMYDSSYFKKRFLGTLSKSIAESSIYSHIENNLDFSIIASKTVSQVTSATKKDFDLLALNEKNCVGKMENTVYADNGQIFEHTVIRYIPDEFAVISYNQKK